ncbi:hypothetical protein HPB51_016525 [Rhipicephalus microplus]|uniref:ubiquitinyl hydrolase 1 n=1 Tax=Rhipicephalus microplus TaxID=6941 RepID=A0A9J6E255_RHIMP|nr:hypothetical protein HPB51_016525 [Rhipicephalus microplus]
MNLSKVNMADDVRQESSKSPSDNAISDVNHDEAILAQEKEIEREIAERIPLVDTKQDLEILEKEYALDDVVYQQKVKLDKAHSEATGNTYCYCANLNISITSFRGMRMVSSSLLSPLGLLAPASSSQVPSFETVSTSRPAKASLSTCSLISGMADLRRKYSHIRKTRPDGNCFFRAFSFAYLESLLNDKEEYTRHVLTLFKKVAENSREDLVSLGFQRFTIEDFHDTFMDVLRRIENKISLEDLLKIFNDQGYSDYIVVYMRLLTSGQLQKEASFFASFIDGERTVKEFCKQARFFTFRLLQPSAEKLRASNYDMSQSPF